MVLDPFCGCGTAVVGGVGAGPGLMYVLLMAAVAAGMARVGDGRAGVCR
jgi:hypothetical protein